MTETVSVIAKITPANSAGIQVSPSPHFKALPSHRGNKTLAPLEGNWFNSAAEAANIGIDSCLEQENQKQIQNQESSRPMRRGKSSVIAKPANTKPVT